MKKGIHPDYGPVAFRDSSTGTVFVTRSTLKPRETTVVDGVEHPVVTVEISSDSHPFWTGQARVMDSQGRVEQFNRRYGRAPRGTTQKAAGRAAAGEEADA